MPSALLLLLQHRRSGSVVPSYRGGTTLSVSLIPCFSSFISVSIFRVTLPAHRLVLPRKVITSLRNAKVRHSVFDEKSSSRFAPLQLNFLRTKPCLIPFPPWRYFSGSVKQKTMNHALNPLISTAMRLQFGELNITPRVVNRLHELDFTVPELEDAIADHKSSCDGEPSVYVGTYGKY